MQKKRWIKTIIFLVIFLILFQGISKTFRWSVGDQKKYPRIAEFFYERKDSLDAVYIGSSSTFAFWQAPVAWEKYGITVRCFTSNSQPLRAVKYLIEDARKTQPDALYIVSINTMHESTTDSAVHYLVDNYPLSLNKLKMIWDISDFAGYSWSERLEFYFPIITYHSRWNGLEEKDFDYSAIGLKGGSIYDNFLEKSEDVSAEYTLVEEKAEINEYPYDTLVDLLEYCKENNVKVLFVTAPQAVNIEKRLRKYNAANELVESYGFPTLNMIPMVDEIGLDLTSDFYNGSHTNVHGSIKYTLWLGNYLIENYGFTDKRSDSAYDDWKRESADYMEIIAPYISEEEYKMIRNN